MGLHEGQTNSGSFKEGQIPWNKGTTTYERANRITINGKLVYEHRHIYETTHGEIPEGMVIHHIDGNNKNNDIDNLQLMTQSEHVKLHHAKLRGELK